jgi:hypothetical protein
VKDVLTTVPAIILMDRNAIGRAHGFHRGCDLRKGPHQWLRNVAVNVVDVGTCRMGPPVRTVVWQGSVSDRRPYADQCLLCGPVLPVGTATASASTASRRDTKTDSRMEPPSSMGRDHTLEFRIPRTQESQLWGRGYAGGKSIRPVGLLG